METMVPRDHCACAKLEVLKQSKSKETPGYMSLEIPAWTGNINLRIVRIERYGFCAKLQMSCRCRKKTKKFTVLNLEIWTEKEAAKKTENEITGPLD